MCKSMFSYHAWTRQLLPTHHVLRWKTTFPHKEQSNSLYALLCGHKVTKYIIVCVFLLLSFATDILTPTQGAHITDICYDPYII